MSYALLTTGYDPYPASLADLSNSSRALAPQCYGNIFPPREYILRRPQSSVDMYIFPPPDNLNAEKTNSVYYQPYIFYLHYFDIQYSSPLNLKYRPVCFPTFGIEK